MPNPIEMPNAIEMPNPFITSSVRVGVFWCGVFFLHSLEKSAPNGNQTRKISAVHFLALTSWQSCLFCKGRRIKQPRFAEPGFEYMFAHIPLQGTHGERTNATCKSYINHLSGFPNSHCLNISRTNTRSLLQQLRPIVSIRSSKGFVLTWSS